MAKTFSFFKQKVFPTNFLIIREEGGYYFIQQKSLCVRRPQKSYIWEATLPKKFDVWVSNVPTNGLHIWGLKKKHVFVMFRTLWNLRCWRLNIPGSPKNWEKVNFVWFYTTKIKDFLSVFNRNRKGKIFFQTISIIEDNYPLIPSSDDFWKNKERGSYNFFSVSLEKHKRKFLTLWKTREGYTEGGG